MSAPRRRARHARRRVGCALVVVTTLLAVAPGSAHAATPLPTLRLRTVADLPFDPDVLGRAMRAMQVTGADVIAGYRHDRTMEGPRRAIYSYVYNALIGVLFGWPHRDINF